jgi:glutathione S-transferase
MAEPHLVTIGLSHYCEKARWALERAGVAFVEEAHAPILHYASTLSRFGQRTVPILKTAEETIRDSTAIVRYADRFVDEGKRLFPAEQLALRHVEELVKLFDRRLGPATRRLAYFHILQDKGLLPSVLGAKIGGIERSLLRVSLPAIRAALRRGLRIDPERAKKSQRRIEAVFEEIEKRIARGGRYLVGERFTAADLTFAALVAPILLPPEYGWPLPSMEQLSPELREMVERMRGRSAGAFALRLYREHRHR